MSEIHDLIDAGDCCPVNKPGVHEVIHIIPSCDVETFPGMKAAYNPATPQDSVTIDGDIVLKSGKKWLQIPTIVDTASLRSAGQGNQGSKGYRNEVQIEIAGADASRIAWWNQVINGCFIAVVKDKNNRYRVIGNLDSSAHFEAPEHIINNEDSKGMGLLFDTVGDIAPFYEGVLPIETVV